MTLPAPAGVPSTWPPAAVAGPLAPIPGRRAARGARRPSLRARGKSAPPGGSRNARQQRSPAVKRAPDDPGQKNFEIGVGGMRP